MPKPKTKFVIKFKDPDVLYDISQAYPQKDEDPEYPGGVWRRTFTRWGAYASVELDIAAGTFRFLPVGK